MNKKCEFETWRCPKFETKRTLEDMQKEMESLNADIRALEKMPLEVTIKLVAIADLMDTRKKLLAEMHEELNRMYM